MTTQSGVDVDETSVETTQEVIKPASRAIYSIVTTYLSDDNTLAPKDKSLINDTIIKLHGLPILSSSSDDLSSIMGNIVEADCVILFYTPQRCVDTISVKCNTCCVVPIFCEQKACQNILEFELKFAIAQEKHIIVFIDKNTKVNSVFQNLFSIYPNIIKVIYYTDIDESLISANFVEIFNTLRSAQIGYFRRKDYCLTVLNKCIQRASVPQKTIGVYTNTSGEMNADSKSEIHVLTNEWYNYDFTTMSSLTIAINTKKGVKYCYYAPERYRGVVDTFKEVLKDYYNKSFKAREKVVAWIRMSKSEHYYLDEFLSSVTNKPIRNIISSLLASCGDDYYSNERIDSILNNCKEGNTLINLSVDKNSLNKWIHGERINNPRTIMRFLRNLGILLNAIKSDESLYRNAIINSFCSKLELLFNMYLLVQWQTGLDEEKQHSFTEEETSAIINYFKYKDSSAAHDLPNNLIISEPFEKWLRPSNEEGLVGVIPEGKDNDVDKYLQNILFLPIDEEMSLTLAYSFTLFLGYAPNGGTYDESAAWYTTVSDNRSRYTEKIDNGLFMVDIGPTDELFPEIKEIFKRIIFASENIRNKLKEKQSVILKIVGWLE
ncbi:MAG: hypothetical protein J5911_05545 [Clostridia bacterium]|nr:hypothetical protein [Clostridia bacterium]